MARSEQLDNGARTAAKAPIQPQDGRGGLSEPPPGPWWRTTMAGAVALVIGLGLLGLIWIFARPLSFVIIGLTIAAALAPVVSWLARWMPRGVAVVLVFLVLALILAGLIWAVFPPLVNEAQQAAQRIPQLIEQAEQRLTQLPYTGDLSIANRISSQLGNITSTLISLPFTILSALFSVVVVIFVSLYALTAGPAMRRFALSLAPDRSEGRVNGVIDRLTNAVGGYVRGVMIDSVIVGILTYIALLLIGVEFPLVLAVLSGLLEIIPLIGPIIAGIIMVAVALLQSPTQALMVLIFAIVLQQVEGNILIPNIMHRETRISPLLSIVAVVLGESVGGLIGILVAIPLAAALRVLILEVFVPAFRRWTGAAASRKPAEVEATS